MSLRDASAQGIQLKLLRGTQHNALDGARVVESLQRHRSLWDAAMLDRFCFSQWGDRPTMGLIKLRGLPYGYWNAYSLYIMTASVKDARWFAHHLGFRSWRDDTRYRSTSPMARWTFESPI